MNRKISPRGLEVILMIGIILVAGFFLRGQRVISLQPISEERLRDDADTGGGAIVRVNVTPRNRSHWEIEIPGQFLIRGEKSGEVLSTGNHLRSTKILFENHRWRLQPAPQGLRPQRETLVIVPRGPDFLRLDRHRYRGELLLTTTGSGSPLLVNRIGLEQYVASVVDGEMPLDFGAEARCAQAVIARSYVLYQQQQSLRKRLPFDVYADTRSQFYPGYQYRGNGGAWYAGESVDGRRCAEKTRGLVCGDQGKLLCTYYSAICGGGTCRGTELFPDASPLLSPVTCEHCAPAPLYRWDKTLSLPRFQTRIQDFLKSRGAGSLEWKSWTSHPRTPGKLPQYSLSDGSSRYTFSGLDLRNLLDGELLPSPLVEVILEKNQVRFRGAGHGHGVGVCQWGARGLATQGKNFRQILDFYYPGVELVAYQSLLREPAIAGGNSPSRNGSAASSPR